MLNKGINTSKEKFTKRFMGYDVANTATHVVNDVASTGTVHHVADDTASTGKLCGGCHGEHWYTMWWMTRRALVHIAMYAVKSTGTLCWMTMMWR